MKTGKIILIICCAALIAFVLGVSGAVSVVNQKEAESMRLTGLLITREPLDPDDSEAVPDEAVGRFAEGGEIVLPEAEPKSGRMYAVLKTSEITDEETGETFTVPEYDFEPVKGYRFITPNTDSPEGPTRNTDCDTAFTDCDISFNTRDDGEDIRLEGTLHVIPDGNPDSCWYFNPVYQLSTGEVYAVGGQFMSFGDTVAGASCGMTLSDKIIGTTDGKQTTDTFSITVNLRFMETPVRVAVAQFDGNDALLAKAEYPAGELPESLSPLPEAQYLLVETLSAASDSSESLSRILVQRADDLFTAFYARDGVCVPQICAVDWQ